MSGWLLAPRAKQPSAKSSQTWRSNLLTSLLPEFIAATGSELARPTFGFSETTVTLCGLCDDRVSLGTRIAQQSETTLILKEMSVSHRARWQPTVMCSC